MKERLDRVGQTSALEERIESKRQSFVKQSQDQSVVIQNLSNFFGTTVSHLPPSVGPLVENHEFTKAWNVVLKYNLVDLDTSYLTMTLQRNILNLQYEPSTDSNFLTFCERFNMTHSLYLFHKWYSYFSFSTIRRIVDEMTDEQFIYEFSSIINTHQLTLPEMSNMANRIIQLKNAVAKTHLSEALRTTLQINPNGSFQQLKTSLYEADNTYNGPRHNSLNSSSHPQCEMCKLLSRHNIVYSNHTTNIPCSAKAVKGLNLYLENNPKSVTRSSGSSSQTTNSTISTTPSNYNHYGHTATKNVTDPHYLQQPNVVNSATVQPGKRQPLPLPAWLDETTQCGNCYRSSLTTGMDSVQRGNEYKSHPTQNCHWRNVKRDRRAAFKQAQAQPQASLQANSATSDNNSSTSVGRSDPDVFGQSGRYDSDNDSHASGLGRRNRRRHGSRRNSDAESDYEYAS